MNIAAELKWSDVRSEIDLLLKRALMVTQAPMGNVQLADWRRGKLFIAAQHGFEGEFLSFFESVTLADHSVCATAFRTGQPALTEDVASDQELSGCWQIFERANVRAVQSTPLVCASGALVGIVSTHFPDVHRPTDIEMRTIGKEARLAANQLIRIRAGAHGHERRLAGSVIALREGRDAIARAENLLSNLAMLGTKRRK